MVRIFWIFSIALFSVSCKSKKETTAQTTKEAEQVATSSYDPKSTVLSISTSPCFGQCPVYDFVVYGNQSVYFNGKRFAHLEGTYTGSLNEAKFNELLELMKKANLTEANEVYDNPNITDLPMTTILFTTETGKQSIQARYNVPDEIKRFIEDVYSFTQTIRWDKDSTTIEKE